MLQNKLSPFIIMHRQIYLCIFSQLSCPVSAAVRYPLILFDQIVL